LQIILAIFCGLDGIVGFKKNNYLWIILAIIGFLCKKKKEYNFGNIQFLSEKNESMIFG